MNRQEQHEAYKQVVKRMLNTFYLEVQVEDIEDLSDLNRFIDLWIHRHIKPPQQEDDV